MVSDDTGTVGVVLPFSIELFDGLPRQLLMTQAWNALFHSANQLTLTKLQFLYFIGMGNFQRKNF